MSKDPPDGCEFLGMSVSPVCAFVLIFLVSLSSIDDDRGAPDDNDNEDAVVV